MSYWIEYQAEAFVVPAAATGLDEDLYLLATEGGSNNTSMRSSRTGCWVQARDWRLDRLGTRQQVMTYLVRVAARCAGGMFKPRGRDMRPEGYIRSARSLLERARSGDDAFAHLVLATEVAAEHPVACTARAAGLIVYVEDKLGEQIARLIPTSQTASGWARFVRVVQPLIEEPGVRSFGRVFGLASSA